MSSSTTHTWDSQVAFGSRHKVAVARGIHFEIYDEDRHITSVYRYLVCDRGLHDQRHHTLAFPNIRHTAETLMELKADQSDPPGSLD